MLQILRRAVLRKDNELAPPSSRGSDLARPLQLGKCRCLGDVSGVVNRNQRVRLETGNAASESCLYSLESRTGTRTDSATHSQLNCYYPAYQLSMSPC